MLTAKFLELDYIIIYIEHLPDYRCLEQHGHYVLLTHASFYPADYELQIS